MNKWFSRGERPHVKFMKLTGDGIIAGGDGILWRLSPEGYRHLLNGDAESDGMPVDVWVKQNCLPVLSVGMEIVVISKSGEEMRCQFGHCDHCGNTECAEHSGPGGKGNYAPNFHVASRWTVEAAA